MSENKKNILEVICDMVCSGFEITQDQLFNKTRVKQIVYARQCFFYLGHTKAGIKDETVGSFPLNYLGEEYRTWDRTSVLHGCAKIEFLKKTYPKDRMRIEALEKALREYCMNNDYMLPLEYDGIYFNPQNISVA